MPIVRLHRWIYHLACALILTGSFLTVTAHAEWSLSVYGGLADTSDFDLEFTEPNGTDLTLHDIPSRDESFRDPPYFGFRLTYWIDRAPNWGLAIDFVHAKIISNLDESVRVTGTRNGMTVDTVEPINNTFSDLEFSHGHNLLTANLIYRWFLSPQRHASLLGRLQPYLGAGAGVAIPHVDINTDDTITNRYQVAGFAAQGLIGLNFDLFKHVSIFVEGRISYADLDVELSGGGRVSANPWTRHFAFGLSFNL